MTLGEIAQLVAAAGIGGMVVSYFSERGARAKRRSEFFSQIAMTRARGDYDDYLVAAMLAGIPRALTTAYVAANQFAYESASRANASEEQKYDVTSSPAEIARSVETANKAAHGVKRLQEIQIELAWHPVKNRLLWRAQLRAALKLHGLPQK